MSGPLGMRRISGCWSSPASQDRPTNLRPIIEPSRPVDQDATGPNPKVPGPAEPGRQLHLRLRER